MDIHKTPTRQTPTHQTPDAGSQTGTSPLLIPVFDPEWVADHLRDGYWLNMTDGMTSPGKRK